MKTSFELSIEVSEQYNFHKDSLVTIGENAWVKNQWPLVYFIQSDKNRKAYVGESTNALFRIKNHLANPKRQVLNKISIIGSDKFNKSATLEIESKLIQYIMAEGSYELQNENYGHINHNYYQQDLYKNLFVEVWRKLTEKKFVTKSLLEIENSEVFKYSPYKSLNEDQYKSVLEILDCLTTKNANTIFVNGSAGTGKTILATYLMKLFHSDVSDKFLEYNDDELREVNYIRDFKDKYPKAKIGLVVAMTSLRESLRNVFRKVPGLNAKMVMSPSDAVQSKQKYDLLIVDESHRLRKYRNIGWMGVFKKNNRKLGLDDTGTELDWIMACSRNQLFFYDAAQSVKPSDVDEVRFTTILNKKGTVKLELQSQMRVKGGVNYIQFVDHLLNVRAKDRLKFRSPDYELTVFDSLKDLYKELEKRESKFGLCRLIAGYSWEWKTDPRRKVNPQKNSSDIELDGLAFKWNTTDKDWVNSSNAFREIGCIHTTQGYDLNYTGVIFGKEINYNKHTNQIEIDPKHYHDSNGKRGVTDPEELKAYIINIYKTIMFRGIRGTFVYACNKELRDYLKQYIDTYTTVPSLRVLPSDEVKPHVNSVPYYDISVAAGDFKVNHNVDQCEWVELPFSVTPKKGYFVCKVVGESMNKIIPNGSYCLFRQYETGSRNGKIVLVQSLQIQDGDFGSGYTVKEYQSVKAVSEEGWIHESITLNPVSSDDSYKPIELSQDEMSNFKVLGIFEKVL